MQSIKCCKFAGYDWKKKLELIIFEITEIRVLVTLTFLRKVLSVVNSLAMIGKKLELFIIGQEKYQCKENRRKKGNKVYGNKHL